MNRNITSEYMEDIRLNKDKFILGREKEINKIIKHFDKVLEGEFAVCTISGEAGVGKTYFASNVANRLLNVNATYVYGKFKHYNNSLFSALNEVFKEIIEHSLTFSDKKLNAVKKLLNAKLGADCNLIIAICPEAERLFGYYRKINEQDYHKLERRFHNAICIFLDIMSQELYPLIIHIDDLQWADEGSLRMIDFLCSKYNSINFYLVLSSRNYIKGAVRENEILESLTEVKNNLTVQLIRLNKEETKVFLSSVFSGRIDDVEEVSKYFFKATLGNPFYIRQLIETILSEEQIHFNVINNKWVFKIAFLKRLQLPEDIKTILIHNIERLSSYDYELLQLMACLGGQANKMIIKKVITEKHEEAIERLDSLCETGLIIRDRYKKNEEYTSYYLSHDIIYEIIHNSMDKEVREEKHYKIANRLIDNPDKIYSEEHRIFIASQLLHCKKIILKELDSSKYTLELFYAGVKAKQMTLIEDAVKFFELCLLLVPASNVAVSKALLWKIKLEYSECLFLCGRTREAENDFNKLIKECTNKHDLVLIKSRFILLYTYSGEYKKGISLSIEVLEHLDYKIRTNYIRLRFFWEIIKSKLLFTNNKIDNLKYMSTVNDTRILNIESTLLRMAAMANLVDEELFALLILKLSNLSARHGVSKFSAPAYSAYSYIVYHFLGDEDKAVKLAKAARTIIMDEDDIKCMTYFILSTFIEHWYGPSDESIKYLKQTIKNGVRGGEFQYSGYAFATLIEMSYVMGMTVEGLNQTFKLLDQFDNRLQQYITKSTLSILQNHLDLLVDNNSVELDEKSINSFDESQKLTCYYFKLQRLYIKGRIEECYELLCKIEPISGLFKGYITQADLLLYMTLVRLDAHSSLKGMVKLKNKRMIDRALNKFKKWINLYKNNHYARYLYIKAKRLEVFDDSTHVGMLYEEGIAFAKEHNQLQLVALGAILAGNYYESNKKIALVYRQEAVKALDIWGAKYYSKSLSQKYIINSQQVSSSKSLNDILSDKDTQNQNSSTNQQVHRLSYHIKQVEEMDKDSTFLYILDNIVKESLADYGAIYIENNDQIYMVYEQKEGKAIKHYDAIPMEKATTIPHKVMRYVVRTGDEIKMNQKPSSGLFVNDTYFDNKDELSLLCIPLKYMDVFAGIVYVEWHENKENSTLVFDNIKSYMPLLIAKTTAELERNKEPKSINQVETPLTKREIHVFKLIIKGLTNKQVGDELGISLSTVKTHIINIYSKLNIKNRVAAVEKAKELGL